MFTLTVELVEVACFKTESIHSADKFVLNGVLYTEEGATVGVALPMMRINDGDRRDLTQYTYTLRSASRIVNIALSGWDIDQNDSWTDDKNALTLVAAAIASGVAAKNPLVGAVVAASATVARIVTDLFVSWDKNDHLFDFHETASLGEAAFGNPEMTELYTRNFRGEGAIADANYSFTLRVSSSPADDVGTPQPDFAETFRWANREASADGFVGAFPTGVVHTLEDRSMWMPCVCFTRDQAEWRDVPIRELQEVALDDFSWRMRATQDYAGLHKIRAGFPNFFDAQYAERVCGTLLLRNAVAEWRDVPRVGELGNAPLNDVSRRFKESFNYAARNGFVGAFPNMYDATYDGTEVCGTILIKPGGGLLKEYRLYRPA